MSGALVVPSNRAFTVETISTQSLFTHLTFLLQPSPIYVPVLGFSSTSYTVIEGDESVGLTIARLSGNSYISFSENAPLQS